VYIAKSTRYQISLYDVRDYEFVYNGKHRALRSPPGRYGQISNDIVITFGIILQVQYVYTYKLIYIYIVYIRVCIMHAHACAHSRVLAHGHYSPPWKSMVALSTLVFLVPRVQFHVPVSAALVFEQPPAELTFERHWFSMSLKQFKEIKTPYQY
jgi:hypothetical protein